MTKPRQELGADGIFTETDTPVRWSLIGTNPLGEFAAVVTVHADGRVEKGPGYTTEDDAWRLLAESMRR